MHHQPLAAFDWKNVATDVTENGAAVLRNLLAAGELRERRGAVRPAGRHFVRTFTWRDTTSAKASIATSRIRCRRGCRSLRSDLYARLAPVANQWATDLRYEHDYPASHREYIERCHAAEQRRPTPLLLRYVAGDYNCLHQDLYGAEWFPLQVIVLLNAPEQDFQGGELLIVEQRPRAQSKGSVISLQQGDAAVIAVNHRPRRGARGYSRVTLRHGVSPLTRGRRHTLGIIFHDAA